MSDRNNKYTKWFHEYYSNRKENSTFDRRLKYVEEDLFLSMEGLIEKYENGDIDSINEYFQNSQHPKYRAKLIIMDFNRFLKAKRRPVFDGVSFEDSQPIYSTDTERQLAMLKLLHEPRKTSELAELLHVSQDTVESYTNKMEAGISFLGTEISVDFPKYQSSTKRYNKSNIHPIFLALNSTELNHLMMCLQRSDDEFVKVVGDKIFTQMTEYARNHICPDADRFEDVPLEYRDEFDEFGYYAKGYIEKAFSSHRAVEFRFRINDENWDSDIRIGTVKFYDPETDMMTIDTNDNTEIIIPWKNVDVIADDDIYD